jgi:hypothetical protein
MAPLTADGVSQTQGSHHQGSTTMFRTFLAAACGVAAISAFGGAAIAQTTAPASGANVPPVKEKKICRSEASTGSIMTKRVCHTQAEWNAVTEANRGTMEDMRDQQQVRQNIGMTRNN